MSQYRSYCATCRAANSQSLLNFPKHVQNAFSDLGFSNWKKALEKFREHEGSSMHKEATLKLAAKSKNRGIDTQLIAQVNSDKGSIEPCC